MDEVFDSRWRSGEYPFDGFTVSTYDLLPVSVLRQAVLAIVERLRAWYPDSRLFTLHDWHEHDGVLLRADELSWEDMLASLVDEDVFYVPMDTNVSQGFFTEERDFYLRYYIPEPSDSDRDGKWGSLDFTGPSGLVGVVNESLARVGVEDLPIEPAKSFFDTRYAG